MKNSSPVIHQIFYFFLFPFPLFFPRNIQVGLMMELPSLFVITYFDQFLLYLHFKMCVCYKTLYKFEPQAKIARAIFINWSVTKSFL